MRVVADPENLAELISDCAELPDAVFGVAPDSPTPPGWPAAWHVDDVCFAQVAGLDDYGS